MWKFVIFIFLLANSCFALDLKQEFFDVTYSSDITYGNKEAKIEVLEFYSLTCHHCSFFFTSTFPEIKKSYIDTGKIKWKKRSYALDEAAIKATLFLECLDEKQKNSYIKILLSKQSSWAYQRGYYDILRNIAALGGITHQDFDKCLNKPKLENQIKDRTKAAREKLEISGTPTFFINGEKLNIFTEEAFKEKLDKLIEQEK